LRRQSGAPSRRSALSGEGAAYGPIADLVALDGSRCQLLAAGGVIGSIAASAKSCREPQTSAGRVAHRDALAEPVRVRGNRVGEQSSPAGRSGESEVTKSHCQHSLRLVPERMPEGIRSSCARNPEHDLESATAIAHDDLRFSGVAVPLERYRQPIVLPCVEFNEHVTQPRPQDVPRTGRGNRRNC
jgi:hypothetical protein